MKYLSLLYFALLFPIWGFSQASPQFQRISHYVFPEFTEGTILFKVGQTQKASLNYNTITEEMIFDKSGVYLALDHIEHVDTVFIKERKFIPQGEVFYEIATVTPAPLYVQHKHAYTLPGKDVGYAGTSQSSATESFSKLLGQGQIYNFELPSDVKLTPKTQLWLKKGDGFTKITNAKSIEAAFPGKNAKKLGKEYKTDFSKPEDVIKLLQSL